MNEFPQSFQKIPVPVFQKIQEELARISSFSSWGRGETSILETSLEASETIQELETFFPEKNIHFSFITDVESPEDLGKYATSFLTRELNETTSWDALNDFSRNLDLQELLLDFSKYVRLLVLKQATLFPFENLCAFAAEDLSVGLSEYLFGFWGYQEKFSYLKTKFWLYGFWPLGFHQNQFFLYTQKEATSSPLRNEDPLDFVEELKMDSFQEEIPYSENIGKPELFEPTIPIQTENQTWIGTSEEMQTIQSFVEGDVIHVRSPKVHPSERVSSSPMVSTVSRSNPTQMYIDTISIQDFLQKHNEARKNKQHELFFHTDQNPKMDEVEKESNNLAWTYSFEELHSKTHWEEPSPEQTEEKAETHPYPHNEAFSRTIEKEAHQPSSPYAVAAIMDPLPLSKSLAFTPSPKENLTESSTNWLASGEDLDSFGFEGLKTPPQHSNLKVILLSVFLFLLVFAVFFFFQKRANHRLIGEYQAGLLLAKEKKCSAAETKLLQWYEQISHVKIEELFLSGQALFSCEKYPSSLLLMEKAIGLQEAQKKHFKLFLFNLEKSNRAQKILLFLKQAQKKFPDEPWFFYKEGILLFEKKQWDEAISLFKDVLALAPNQGKYLLAMGLTHLYKAQQAFQNNKLPQEETKQALLFLEKTAQQAQFPLEVFQALGDAHFIQSEVENSVLEQKRHRDKSQEYYNIALQKKPTYRTYSQKSLLSLKEKKYSEADMLLKQAISSLESYPQMGKKEKEAKAQLLFNLGYLYELQNKFNESIQSLLQSISLSPLDKKSHCKLSQLYKKIRLHKQSQNFEKQCKALD